MPSWLPSIPYSNSTGGYWDPVTSTLNWCEEDYYLTHYAAEITNTLTNLLFLYYGYLGVRNCVRFGHDTIFIIAFLGYIVVGAGSFLFHATLKYPMQLVDELSMIYTTCLMAHATFGFGRSKGFQTVLGMGLVTFAVGVSVYYHYLQDPKFHQTAYAALTTVIVLRSVWVMETTLRPRGTKRARTQKSGGMNGFSEGTNSEEREKALKEKNLEILRTMWLMVAVGLTTFLTGFWIWHLDNVHCSRLRRWRRELGMPWGFFLEGHAWWHLMTGTGGFYYIVWGIWLRQCLYGKQNEYDLLWRSILSLPEVVKTGSEGRQRTSKDNKKDS